MSLKKISPPPIHETIVIDGKMTQALVRYFMDLNSAIFDSTRELVISTTINTDLTISSQTILVDATSGDVNITLPPPTACFSNSRSLRITVSKIDTSSNAVNILPNSSESIVGEVQQSLLMEGERYNFITDGTNWH